MPRFLAEEALAAQPESEPVVDAGADGGGVTLGPGPEEGPLAPTRVDPLHCPEMEVDIDCQD